MGAEPRLEGRTRSRLAADANVIALLLRADAALETARGTNDPVQRFEWAHRATLRAAGAVVADRRHVVKRFRSLNVWDRLERVAPEIGELTDERRRAAALRERTASATSRGARSLAPTPARADSEVKAASVFLESVRSALGVASWHAEGPLRSTA